MHWRVPKADEAEVDGLWALHEAWMRETHNTGEEKSPRLNHYYISKGEELADPMDPTKGTTGNIIYTMSESYVDASDIGKHMGLGWKDMDKLMAANAKYAINIDVASTSVWKTMGVNNDTYPSIVKDKVCIHLFIVVPAEDEKTVDALWESHEAWMRETHNVEGDEKSPQMLHYYISKGAELTDPMDPTKGTTGNIIYTMSETYVAPADIGKHMALGWKDMDSLMGFNGKYGKFTDVGMTKVWKTM